MGKLDSIIAKHLELADFYGEALANSDMFTIPTVPEGCKHVYQTYAVLLDKGINRQTIIQELRQTGIEGNIGTYSVSAQPAYQPCEIPPNSLLAHHSALALPFHTRMTKENIVEVADSLLGILKTL